MDNIIGILIDHVSLDEKTALANVVSYFQRFGSKSCCFEDVQTYVAFLRGNNDEALAFIQSLKDTVKDSDKKVRIEDSKDENVGTYWIIHVAGSNQECL